MLLQNASTLDKVPSQFQNPVELAEAMDRLKQGNFIARRIAVYDRFVDARRVMWNVRDTRIRMGREEGKKKAQLEIARQLLLKFDAEEVAHITGLLLDEVNQLRE